MDPHELILIQGLKTMGQHGLSGPRMRQAFAHCAPRLAYAYAFYIIKGPFPEAEERITQDTLYAKVYAM
jgi:hypothetical protein